MRRSEKLFVVRGCSVSGTSSLRWVKGESPLAVLQAQLDWALPEGPYYVSVHADLHSPALEDALVSVPSGAGLHLGRS